MSPPLEEQLDRWRQAGLLDAETAGRIRAFEAARPAARSRWPVQVALGAGGLMVTAGILLFVAANWDRLSPAGRGTVLLGALVFFHAAGAAAGERLPALAATLHAIGTATLGAVIFLLGQTYNLEEEWPRGFLLWSAGAWAGWLLLRNWPQAIFAALLTPLWLVVEWVARHHGASSVVPAAGSALLAFVYLAAESPGGRESWRRALAIIGALALLPLGALLLVLAADTDHPEAPRTAVSVGWLVAVGGPLVLAWVLRQRLAWHAAIAAIWVVVTAGAGHLPGVLSYVWAGIAALLVIASGVAEANGRRISVGFGGFAVTVVVFYFASVLDRFGRATSLVIGGALFLAVGALLERLRRRLVAEAGREGAP